jgi:NADPH2:quinone reductase
MRAVVVTEAGGPEVLEVQDRPDPVPGAGEVVVRLAAANINPTDIGARHGMFPPGLAIDGPPYVLGWDLAGEVVAVGDDVSDHQAGDLVVAMIPWYAAGARYGAYAELVLLRGEWLVELPADADPVHASTLPLNALTAEQALAELGAPRGAEVLITGASGGVGSFAVQVAVALGLRVTAVAGTGDEEWLRELGAEQVLPRDVDYSTVGPFQYVLDAVPLGAGVFPAVGDGGTIVSTRPIGDEAGRDVDQRWMLIESDREALRSIVDRFAAGELRTRVAQTVPLDQADEAHRLAERSGRQGKIVLVP